MSLSAPQDNDRRTRTPLAGAGMVLMAGIGTVVGLLVAGGDGIAIGAGIGAAVGLLLGAVADMWQRRT